MKKMIILFCLCIFGMNANAQNTIWSWGYNLSGQLGNGTTTDQLLQVPTGTANDWKLIECGQNFTVAIKSDGTLWAWGKNSSAQLGDGTSANKTIPTQIGADTDWKLVSAGNYHVIALKNDGTLWAWGENTSGQLGDGTNVNIIVPTRIGTDNNWVSLSAGTENSFGIKNDGTLWAWGNNASGKLGDGTMLSRNIPTQIGTGTNWKQVAAGTFNHTLAIQNDGTLWAWGDNTEGQLGDPSIITNQQTPKKIGTDNTWSYVSAGAVFSMGLKANGSLWGWGGNSENELGIGNISTKLSPSQIGTETNWKAMACGGNHVIALKKDGTIWGWGKNANGQVGDGGTDNIATPKQIGTSNKWTQVIAGERFSVALKLDGIIPAISYIIPDIGTPGMNTYMEIIANTDGFSNYGSDRTVENPYIDPALKIEFKNSDDSKKIDFGPLVVSWRGRMIATQVFVNPYIPMPNSFHWDLLTPDNIIEFRIVKGYHSSEWQKFYLVKPYHFNDLSNNITDNVFGENNLGKRSPRGCMIVDSLKLNSITYKVSTNDCDIITPGNQGYLPFVLLAKGNIVGKYNAATSTFSKISLDAASAPDAAPGGGGGGGKFCDFTGEGYNGGRGFVGGGAGGKNASGFGSNSYKNWGESSGLDGNSMNGVIRPEQAWYENAGGGTGHPFGISGKGSFVQTPSEANNRGGYGGGSGDGQVTKGGGAGNSTLGIGTNAYNAGKIHGNKLVVPISGGSGGASGNPNGMGDCSGNGGGGGGAIRIFACDITDLEISAQGANGSTGSSGTDGGGGSGGYVGVFAKYQTVEVKAYVDGGKTGNGGAKNGAGRVRFDIFKPMIGTTSTPNATTVPEANYLGFTTDSTTFVPRKYKIKGTKQMNDVLDLYLKSKSDPLWIKVGTISTNAVTWSQDLDLTGTDSVFYFLATKQIETPGRQDSAQYLPNIDFSQAAANILRIDKFPEISGDSASQIDTYYCEGNIKYDTVKIWNKGKIALNLKLSSAIFKHYPLIAGFDYLPKRDTVLAPNDTLKLVISYTVQPGIKGTVIDTLEIAHNDLTAYHQPWLVECTANIDEFGGEFYDAAKTNKIIELDFGDLCPNTPKTLTASVKNISATNVELDDFVLALGTKFNATITNRSIPKDGFVTFDVTYLGGIPGSSYSADELYLRLKGCPTNLATLKLKANVIKPGIAFEKTPIDLGIICKGKSSNVKTLEITNRTELPLDLTYTILPAINGLSFNLSPNSKLEAYGKLTANIGFDANGLTDGTYSWKIALNDANCGNFSDTIFVSAKVQTTTLKADPTSDFGLVQVGFDKTNAITLKNIGTGVANITSLPIAKAPFEIVSSVPPTPTQIAPNGQITYNVIFKPTAQGTFYDTLRFESFETGTTCSALDSTLLMGSASMPKVLLSRNDIDFGLLATCQKKTEKFTATNVGTFAVNISKVEITGADNSAFKIISPNANTLLKLSPNQSQDYEVVYDASVLPLGIHNAEVVFTADVIMPKVKLIGENDSVKIIMNPTSPISLGAVPKGNTKTIDIEIKNLSKLLVVINSFTSNNCTITPNSLTLNGGEAKIITVNALVEQTGINNFSIDYAITAPCAGNGLINLQAVGLEGKVVFPDKFPFGLLDPCQTLSKPWTITNTGDADIDLNSASISGTDATLFTIENPITAKITLAPTQSHTLNILFDPTASVDGMKSANLVVKSTMNAQTVDLITQLSGERRAGLLSTPPNLAFNDVRVNASKNLSIELKNTGVQTIIIDSIKLPTQNSIFIVNPQNLNITMPVGGLPTNLNVDFKPTDIRFYEDSLIVYFNVNNCKDSVSIVLKGSGIPATIVKLRLPIFKNIDPKLTQLDIPIYAKLENSDNDLPIKDLSISMQVQLNGTLYIPTHIIPSGHTFSQIINTVGERTITINLNKVEVGKEEKILGTIQGVPLLGNSIETPLAIKILSYDNLTDVSKIEVEDGLLSYTICQNGDDRLIEYKQPQLMKINQNPPGDFINLEITTLEQGNHSLKIVNTLGEEQIIDNWYSDGKTNNVKKYSVPTVEYSSGTYIIILQGPNKMTTQQLQIIK